MKKKKEKMYLEVLDVKKIKYIEIDLFKNGKYHVSESYWPEILKKVYWRGGFFVVESTTGIHIYSPVMTGKIEVVFKKIKIDNSEGPGEIEFTGVMPSEMTGWTQIPKDDLPSFSQYSDIKDDKLEGD